MNDEFAKIFLLMPSGDVEVHVSSEHKDASVLTDIGLFFLQEVPTGIAIMRTWHIAGKCQYWQLLIDSHTSWGGRWVQTYESNLPPEVRMHILMGY